MTLCTQFLLAVAALAAPPAPLTEAVRAAIVEALADERLGEAVYARVLKDHGDVRPFSNVIHAERRHAGLLEALLEARDLPVPAVAVPADVPAYAGVKAACAAAVEFEAKNVALYDRLLAAGATAEGTSSPAGRIPEDVRAAFEHNRMASLDHHKPAFERCAGVVAGQGMARGRGHSAGAGSNESRACDRDQGRGGGHGSSCGHTCGCGHGSGHVCGRNHAPGGAARGL